MDVVRSKFPRHRALSGAAAVAASAALAACGGGSSTDPAPVPPLPPPTPSASYDTIVVGAGIAGISAARTVQSYGGRVLILEAQSYVGGRTRTDNSTFSEIGFDLGAQFFHQVLSGNELLQIAQARGIPTLVSNGPGGLPLLFFQGSTPVDPLSTPVAQFVGTSVGIKSAIFNAGVTANGNPTLDSSVGDVVGGLSGLPFYPPALAANATVISGGLATSNSDVYNWFVVSPAPFVTPGEDVLIRSGMGNFVQSLAMGLNVQLNAPVTSIATSPSGATVTTASGAVYFAKTAIVTASTSVLAAGSIAFSPALPPSYTQAFASLPLGSVYKCLLGFKTSYAFPNVQGFSIVLPLVNSGPVTYMFPRFWNTNTVEFLAAGDLAYQLDTRGPAYALSVLLPALESVFPGSQAAFDGRITVSSWIQNPYTRGAYSAAKVGQVGARTLLAQPVGSQLWFAGEAVTPGGAHSSLHGAYRSGLAAANGVARAIGLTSRPRAT